MLVIKSKRIAEGSERKIYRHPNDPKKIIKINRDKGNNLQSKREIKFYNKLIKKCSNYQHIPEFYGVVKTSKGTGMVLDYILDFDNSPSKSLAHYIEQNGVAFYVEKLGELRDYFLNEGIIFNYDIWPSNILVKRTSEEDYHLVLIDALGDVVLIQWMNNFKYFLDAKILRRWSRFEARLKRKYSLSEDVFE